MQLELHRAAIGIAMVRTISVLLSAVWIVTAIYLWTRNSSDRVLSASLGIVATANAWYTLSLKAKKARLTWIEYALLAVNVLFSIVVGFLVVAFATYVHGSAVSH
jgi:uncharacterized membrane protein (DUF485 family)